MRNLTLTRNKSFVACLMKDQVYIRDEQAAELTIDGEPCRKLGTIKSGEQKTFQIGEGEQKLFLIADKASKEYCNASVTIPAGQEDVVLSGKHHFHLGSNPFQFDGVELSAQELAKQKKNKRRGTLIYIVAVAAGVLIGHFATDGLFGAKVVQPEVIQKEDFKMTLTNEFEPQQLEGAFITYETDSMLVFAIREEKELFGDITLEEYAELVLQANDRTELAMNSRDDYLWFEYTDKPDNQEIYYVAACYKSQEAYWIVNFATPATNTERYRESILRWADSVEVG